MAKKLNHVACIECRLGQERVLKQSFMGFHKFSCEECEAKNTYPLPMSYVVIYAASIVIALVTAALGIYRCGGLAVFGLVALLYNIGIRNRSKEALENVRSKTQIVADVFE